MFTSLRVQEYYRSIFLFRQKFDKQIEDFEIIFYFLYILIWTLKPLSTLAIGINPLANKW